MIISLLILYFGVLAAFIFLVSAFFTKKESFYYNVKREWIPSSVGFWDTDLIYDKNRFEMAEVSFWKISYLTGANIRQCLKLNKRFLQ